MVGTIEKAALRLGIGRDSAALCGSGVRKIILEFTLSGSDQNDVARRASRLQDVECHVRNRLFRRVERMHAEGPDSSAVQAANTSVRCVRDPCANARASSSTPAMPSASSFAPGLMVLPWESGAPIPNVSQCAANRIVSSGCVVPVSLARTLRLSTRPVLTGMSMLKLAGSLGRALGA